MSMLSLAQYVLNIDLRARDFKSSLILQCRRRKIKQHQDKGFPLD